MTDAVRHRVAGVSPVAAGLFAAGLVLGGATAFLYDGPYELLPVAVALVLVLLGAERTRSGE